MEDEVKIKKALALYESHLESMRKYAQKKRDEKKAEGGEVRGRGRPPLSDEERERRRKETRLAYYYRKKQEVKNESLVVV
jgi:hypothetical protein